MRNIKENVMRLLMVAAVMIMVGAGARPAQAAGNLVDKDFKVEETKEIFKEENVFKFSDGRGYEVVYKFLNVRCKPTTSSKKVGELKKTNRIYITEIKDGFGKIRFSHRVNGTKHKYAWICMDKSYVRAIKDGWVKKNGVWEYYRSDIKTTIRSNTCHNMHKHIAAINTTQPCLVIVNKTRYAYMVFDRVNGVYVPRYSVLCKIGMPGWETPCGTHKIKKKFDSFTKNGYQYNYCLKFWGECIDHSLACKLGTRTQVEAPKGVKGTHGCVSKSIKVQKYVYDHYKVGHKYVVFSETKKYAKYWK